MVLLCGFSARLNGAENIAVVNLEKVFREYYKSGIAEQFIRQRAESLRTYLAQMNTQLESLRADARKSGTEALNMALRDDERTRARTKAAEAARKVKAKEAEIELYIQESSRDMRELENKKRAEIMNDISAAVKRRAASHGFTFVLDSSGKSFNNQPVVLYHSGNKDLTDVIIRDLNRSANKKTTGKSAK